MTSYQYISSVCFLLTKWLDLFGSLVFGSDRSSINANLRSSVRSFVCPVQTCLEQSIFIFLGQSNQSTQRTLREQSKSNKESLKIGVGAYRYFVLFESQINDLKWRCNMVWWIWLLKDVLIMHQVGSIYQGTVYLIFFLNSKRVWSFLVDPYNSINLPLVEIS